MSQENVEIVRRRMRLSIAGTSLAGYARPTRDPADVEFCGGGERGVEGWRADRSSIRLEDVGRCQLEFEACIDVGDRVVASCARRGRMRKGMASRVDHGLRPDLQMRDGQVVRCQSFRAWQEALKAVGLEE